MKRKLKPKQVVGNCLIAIGAALIIVGVGYEATIYPWRIVLQQVGVSVSQELPEPAALPQMTAPPGEHKQNETILMESANMFASRPEVGLTKLGTIQIAKIGISENIVEGVGNEMLYAVGHMPDTPMPGEPGNCVLAAHRDYVRMNPFRHLDKVQPGDKVRIRVGDDLYFYEVFKNFVVQPNEVWVTQPQPDSTEMITLLTCTPVITSTHRMVVWARLCEVRLNGAAT